MALKLKETHNPDDAFCFYCQKQYSGVLALNRHIKEMHKGSIVYYSLLQAEEDDMLHQIAQNDF